MQSVTRRCFLGLAAGTAAFPAIRSAKAAQRMVTVASLLGADKPETKIWLHIRDLIEQKLPGQFSFRIVQNAALGGEKEVAEGIRLGSVQGSLSTVSALSGWVPQTQLLDLPFLFRDAAHLEKVLSGEVGEDLRRRLAEQGFIVPAYINYGVRHLLAKREILRPDALQGMRIRIIQSPLHTALWRSYGANPVAIAIPETYNALKTGVADAMDLTKSAYAGFKLYEVVPCVVETGHIWASGVVYFSKGFWTSLNPDQQTVFSDAAKEGARYFNRLIAEDETASMEQAKKGGAWIVQPQDRKAWETGARKVWQDYAPVVGGMERVEMIGAIE